MTGNLILVLGDQLSHALAALRAGDPARDRVLIVEVMAEATCVRHHKKKLVFDGTGGGDSSSMARLTVDDMRFLFQ